MQMLSSEHGCINWLLSTTYYTSRAYVAGTYSELTHELSASTMHRPKRDSNHRSPGTSLMRWRANEPSHHGWFRNCISTFSNKFYQFFTVTNQLAFSARISPCGTFSSKWQWTSINLFSTSGPAAPKTHLTSRQREATTPWSRPKDLVVEKVVLVRQCRTFWTVHDEVFRRETIYNSLNLLCQEQINLEGKFWWKKKTCEIYSPNTVFIWILLF